jgi:hypothetical protein
MLYLAALVVLVVFLIVAQNNRFLGRELYAPKVGEWVAHCVGALLQVLFVFVVTWLLLRWLGAGHGRAELWTIGVLWVVLAEVWELVVLRRLKRLRWEAVLAEYSPIAGRIWWLVPLAYLLAPVLVAGWMA